MRPSQQGNWCLLLPCFAVAAPESQLRFSLVFSLWPGCMKMSLDTGSVSSSMGESKLKDFCAGDLQMCAETAYTHSAWTGGEVRDGKCSERRRCAFSPGFTMVNEDENIGSNLNYTSIPSPHPTVYFPRGRVPYCRSRNA